jgi:putative ABC transport system ATP-binding protein
MTTAAPPTAQVLQFNARRERMIQLEKVSKVYVRNKVETKALESIDLKVTAGEFVAVTGPSGCGKSTLLNVLGIMDAPTSGTYLLDGTNVYEHSERELVELRNKHIGFIFQSFNLLESPSVFENVELPLIYRKMDKKERRAKVTAILESLKLRDFADFHPTELSGGEQQRVAVARALVGDPKLVLADEPTGNLDSKSGEVVMQLLETMNKNGVTIIMVTHSASYAARAHRVVEMLDGKIRL